MERPQRSGQKYVVSTANKAGVQTPIEGGEEDEYGDVRQQLMRQEDNLTAVMIEAGIDDDYEAVRCSS